MQQWIRYAQTAILGMLVVTAQAQATESDKHLPIGTRSIEAPAPLCPEKEECDCGCEEQMVKEEAMPDADQQTLQARFRLFFGEQIYPGSCQQVRFFLGPDFVYLTDGRVQELPPGWYGQFRDGSIWRVADQDVWAISDWSFSDEIHLMFNHTWFSTPYRYLLYNVDLNRSIRLYPQAGPKFDRIERLFVYDRSFIEDEVVLSDGSHWKVTSFDRQNFSEWLLDDSIVIGVNDDWMSTKYPNFLFNLTTNTWIRARWLY